jgi:hypothetical protein
LSGRGWFGRSGKPSGGNGRISRGPGGRGGWRILLGRHRRKGLGINHGFPLSKQKNQNRHADQPYLLRDPVHLVIQLLHLYYTPSETEKENVSVKKNLRVFSQSSGLKGPRKYSIAQAQGVHSARGRTASAGKHPNSGAVAWIPQGTFPRPPWPKPNHGSNRSEPSMFRREPMKEPLPHDVLPRAGCTPWARATPSPQRTRGQLENAPKPPARLR